ncbi:hypothetical protein KKJ06_12885 [Xenorhabdus bovienii]|uniref:beta-ketoacyl synthase N-terminal-like domain-containing protein n=1 Tax=Xenorhabdus bovienii TaxID=40576 RepID=UPI0023B2677D|nr:beta-ketoacyl synthase N-terminal-like domain-containing protein [Xenorhabdus bovienii]MDE9482426.1 hypothetical protein [Xenorhabdus bovienii]MDE9556302.1 hypothetical protein [Xenorhabdus bovienii]
MLKSDLTPLITATGICSAIGCGNEAFRYALHNGATNFRIMQRPGRQYDNQFIGAEITEPFPASPSTVRNPSLTINAALTSLHEAWQHARLDRSDPERIGIIIGGSNLQQREHQLVRELYQHKASWLTPRYAMNFMDTDISACLSEEFGIRGFAYSVGGASASGNLALILAAQAIQRQQVDIAICVGALSDLSWWELQALSNVGAMGSARFAANPSGACRPFDALSDGFIFGEACGVLVIEAAHHAMRRQQAALAAITGWAFSSEANRGPEASVDGEARVMMAALGQAGWTAQDIDYVNPHGSGSPSGDRTELAALQRCQLNHARINATKSLTGHTLSAAGSVEAIATLIQMQHGFLHGCQNLDAPLNPDFNWVKTTEFQSIQRALNLSYGFGGMNTALCLEYIG